MEGNLSPSPIMSTCLNAALDTQPVALTPTAVVKVRIIKSSLSSLNHQVLGGQAKEAGAS